MAQTTRTPGERKREKKEGSGMANELPAVGNVQFGLLAEVVCRATALSGLGAFNGNGTVALQ